MKPIYSFSPFASFVSSQTADVSQCLSELLYINGFSITVLQELISNTNTQNLKVLSSYTHYTISLYTGVSDETEKGQNERIKKIIITCIMDNKTQFVILKKSKAQKRDCTLF